MLRLLLIALLSISGAYAAEADVAANLKESLGKQIGEVTQVNKSSISGLYEVVTSDHIFYVDETGQFLIDGNLIDLKTRRSITEARSRQLFAVDFNKLPLELAIKKVKGNGSRKLAYFTDPNCSYCKKLERELQAVDDVTLYVFLYPIFDGSAEKSNAVWCSKDKAKAWDELMIKGVIPRSDKCNSPTVRVLELGKKLKVNGTPALIFANGTINPGYLPAAELNKAIDSNK
ncbi:MAG: DsbC family protein [Gallionellaceae bacterium]